jgi:hypothetical protein
VFTRVVNHWVIRPRDKALNRPARTEGASRESRLDQTLKLGHETGRGQKTTRKQDLTPIRVQLPTARLHQRIRFC